MVTLGADNTKPGLAPASTDTATNHHDHELQLQYEFGSRHINSDGNSRYQSPSTTVGLVGCKATQPKNAVRHSPRVQAVTIPDARSGRCCAAEILDRALARVSE